MQEATISIDRRKTHEIMLHVHVKFNFGCQPWPSWIIKNEDRKIKMIWWKLISNHLSRIMPLLGRLRWLPLTTANIVTENWWQVEKNMDLLQTTPSLVSCWQIPLHFDGTGPIPSSLKLFDSGQTPSTIPFKMARHDYAIGIATVAHALLYSAKREQKLEWIVKLYFDTGPTTYIF